MRLYCTLSVPLELPIITREHFNRWYSVKAYYFAMTIADLPIQMICVLTFVAITYLMTGQPLELYRVSIFFWILLMVTLVGQALGTLVGSIFNVTVSLKNVYFPYNSIQIHIYIFTQY